MRGVFLCAANPTFFPDLLSDEDHEKDTLEDHEKDTLEDHEKEKYAREASVKRGWNLCGRVRERGVFSVWDDRRERKNASRRRSQNVGTLYSKYGPKISFAFQRSIFEVHGFWRALEFWICISRAKGGGGKKWNAGN